MKQKAKLSIYYAFYITLFIISLALTLLVDTQRQLKTGPDVTLTKLCNQCASSQTRPKLKDLWIHVYDVSEGMANWRIGIVELLLLSKSLDATFVEPCIFQGRVTSCHKLTARKVRLSDVYDPAYLRRIHSKIATQEIFEANTKNVTKRFQFCMHEGNPSPLIMCNLDGVPIPNFYHSKSNGILQQAIQESQPSIIEIHAYRKGGLTKLEVSGMDRKKVINQTEVQYSLYRNLVFHKNHYIHVSGFLKALGIIQQPYNVIHWRSESHGTNYMDCVQKLLVARKVMSPKEHLYPTILISSLNTISAFQWGTGEYLNQRSAIALRSLIHEHGFLKLDTIQGKPLSDIIDLAVWDQILTQNATKFATCTKLCRAKQSCKACNYLGSFGELAISMRESIGRSSLACWPGKGEML
jgi:hypothetical protein